MDSKEISNLVTYWLKTSEHDYDTMIALYKTKRYSDSLFFGHIMLEKILKGLVVKNTVKQAPYVHDLLRLQEISGAELSNIQKDLLDKVNDFNIRSRYPEYKLDFYKLCTQEYAKNYLNQIIKLYEELCQKLKQQK